MQPIVIDIVSDAVCPWCFLGKRRLEAALASADEAQPEVRWRPFQLDPTIPAGGLERRAYMSAKFPDESRLAEVHDRLKGLGEAVGIRFDFAAIQRSPNTLDAHRLIAWAGETGAQDRMVETLFSYYFEQGRDIGDRATLTEAAAVAGLDAQSVTRRLATDESLEGVRAEIAQAQQLGVSGVPFFIFAGRLGVAGAQSAEVLQRALAQARALPADAELG